MKAVHFRFPVICAAIALLPALFGTSQANHKCLYGSIGCGGNFSCSTGSGDCPDAQTWIRKSGVKVPYNQCFSRNGFTCDLITVVCNAETHYVDNDCTNACELVNTTTFGCL